MLYEVLEKEVTYDAPIASDISAKNRKLNKPLQYFNLLFYQFWRYMCLKIKGAAHHWPSRLTRLFTDLPILASMLRPCLSETLVIQWRKCWQRKWPHDYFYLIVATTIVFQPTWQMVQLQWLQYKHHNQVLRTTESRVDSDDKNLVDNYKRLPTEVLVGTLLISSVRLQLRGLRTTSAPHLWMGND